MTLTTESWKQKAIKVHGNRYDYSNSNYTLARANIEIVCKEHGPFFQIASEHIHQKRNCPKCVGGGNPDINLFLYNARKIHGDRYDYSCVEYVNAHTPIKIICKEHGIFFQSSVNHITNKRNCPKCVGGIGLTLENYLNQARLIHGDRYDYSEIKFIQNQRIKVQIICKEHGPFFQCMSSHIHAKSGCPKCYAIKNCADPILVEKNKLADRIRKNIQYGFSRYSKNGKIMSSSKYGIDFAAIFEKIGPKPEGNFHIDHIIPMSAFDFDNSLHVRLAHHPENLRWLDAFENISKSDSIDFALISSNPILVDIAKQIGIME